MPAPVEAGGGLAQFDPLHLPHHSTGTWTKHLTVLNEAGEERNIDLSIATYYAHLDLGYGGHSTENDGEGGQGFGRPLQRVAQLPAMQFNSQRWSAKLKRLRDGLNQGASLSQKQAAAEAFKVFAAELQAECQAGGQS